MELEARNHRAIERRFKCSRLQAQPSIDAFHFHHHKTRLQNKNRILRLLDLEFLHKGTNLVFIGNPGVGKTFLSKIIGWRICQANQCQGKIEMSPSQQSRNVPFSLGLSGVRVNLRVSVKRRRALLASNPIEE